MSTITNKVLTLPDLRAKGIPWSRTHLGRLVERGEFPTPFRLGAMTLAWKESDIDNWIAERIAGGSKVDDHTRATAVKAARASAAVRRKA